MIPGHQGIPGNAEADRLTKEKAIEVPSNQFTAIPFSVGKKSSRKIWNWSIRPGGLPSKLIIRYPLLSRPNELLAVSRFRLEAAVGLLTGHTSLRVHLHKLGQVERQECRLCEYNKEDSVHIVCHCPVLACERYRTWGSMFLRSEGLEKERMGSLLGLVANIGLGLAT
jgi:hypothetical protein